MNKILVALLFTSSSAFIQTSISVFTKSQLPLRNPSLHHTTKSSHVTWRAKRSTLSSTLNTNNKSSADPHKITNNGNDNENENDRETWKLEGKLMKQLRETSLQYSMIENNDHIMVCISGGKDSLTLLHLLLQLQSRLAPRLTFKITAVHLNQMQPDYDNSALISWFQNVAKVPYLVVNEDTYSIVKEKTPPNKAYCSLCSRLRRGVLYSVAHDIGATKLALGHHGDDAVETLLLNFVHAGQMKGMPARYYSEKRGMHVIRPLIGCLEDDIGRLAALKNFPIMPCNLCGSQPDGQRKKVKMLCHGLEVLNPNAKRNMIRAMGDVRPSHLLDVALREACGLDGVTGRVKEERARSVRGYEDESVSGEGDDEQEEELW